MKFPVSHTLLVTASASLASMARADTSGAVPGAATAATGQMASLLLSMLAIIALIAGAAWLLKRLAPRHYSSNNTLRIVAGAAVGQRERVVVVEIGTSWLVLGVAPGQVTALHHLPRPEPDTLPAEPPADKAHPFALWLQQLKKTHESK